MKNLGSPVHASKLFEELAASYGNKLLVSVVYYQNMPIGGGIILMTDNSASIPWASTVQLYNHLAPNMLLYWSLLSYATDHKLKLFDFGRSTPNEGTYKFKAQWGAAPHAIKWSSYNSEKELVETNSSPGKIRGLIESTWQKLPLSLTLILGPLVRRFISL